MKLKRFIAIAMCLATVLTVTAACSKDKPKDVTVYETDMWGETVTNDKGENVTVPVEDASVEYVTDENGNQLLDENGEKVTILHYYVHDVDDEGNVVTNENKEPVTKEYVSNPSTTASAGSIEDMLNGGEIPTVEVETMPEGTTVQTTKRLYDKNFRDILASGKFYIEMIMKGNMDGIGYSAGYGLAVSGDKSYMKTNVNLLGIINMTIESIMRDNKIYLLSSKKKVYMETEMDTDMSGEMIDSSTIQEALGSSTAVYQKTSVVKSGKTTYICEEYLDNGIVYKYYFDQSSEVLKRIEYDTGDGTTIVMDINKIMKNPDSSYFEIPSGYKKVTEDEFYTALLGGYSNLTGTATTKANEE